jgi:hypothetical protein
MRIAITLTRRWYSSMIGLAVIVGCVPGCVVPSANIANRSASLGEAYEDSIYEAAVFDQQNVDQHPLLQLAPGVLTVTTWTSKATADRYYPLGPTSVGVDVWVTVVPEVKKLCTNFSTDRDALQLRLQQLLGLPPNSDPEERMFVIMEVPSTTVVRPCPDPDPSKASCTWNFPANATEKYKAWFAEQMVSRYRKPDGFPWTRLGYTYDWAPDGRRSTVSEFVLPKGSAAKVINKVPTQDYCHPPLS